MTIIEFIIIIAVNMNSAIPIGIVLLSISSLRPYLLESDIPIKFPTVFTIESNIMQYRRSLGESAGNPASLIMDGP